MALRESTAVYASYLLERLQRVLLPLGGYAFTQTFDSGLPDAGPEPLRTRYVNVVGFLPGLLGSEARGVFLLGAHWDATSEQDASQDSTWSPLTAPAPGADDNASGVAVILEALRVAGERGFVPQADVMVVFFDGEERQFTWDAEGEAFVNSGKMLLGSTHLADSLARAGTRIYGLVNVDMVAFNPRVDSLVVVTNLPSRWLADQLSGIRAGSSRTGWADDLILTRLVKGLTFSDHGPFWEKGYDAVLVLESPQIERHAGTHYHSGADTVDFTYSRHGSQAAKAAELVAGLLESWSWTAEDSLPDLRITAEDVLVQDSLSVDLAAIPVGVPVQVAVGFTNRGGTLNGGWSLEVSIEDLDGHGMRGLGMEANEAPVPAGGRITVPFPWIPGRAERGAVRVAARLEAADRSVTTRRLVAVAGSPAEVPRAFVYPNPTRDPASAVVRYELTEGGAVRLSVVSMTGRVLAERDEIFDPVFPGETVDPGLAEIGLGEILGDRSLAPGLYFLRVELFPGGGGGTGVAVTRFAVLR
jgi:hypothetical protein